MPSPSVAKTIPPYRNLDRAGGTVPRMLATERLYREVPAWTEQLATLLEGADPGTPVPTAPEWTLVELSAHVGYAFRWMTTTVATQATAPVRRRDTQGRRAPDDPGQLPAWLRGGATELVAAGRSGGASTPGWAWGGGREPAGGGVQGVLF